LLPEWHPPSSPACRPRRRSPPEKGKDDAPLAGAGRRAPRGAVADPRLAVGTLEVPPLPRRGLFGSRAAEPFGVWGSVGSAGLGGLGCPGSNGKVCQARRKRAPSGSPGAPGLGRAPGNGPDGSGVAIRRPACTAPSTLERRRRSSRGSEAQGSIGRLCGGNAGESQRTRRWIKALRPVATPRAAARLPPGRPGLWHRARLTVRRHRPR